MPYAIMRTAKLKSAGNVAGSLSHARRERETPNADAELTKDNVVLVEGDMEKYEQMLEGIKSKKDSVRCIELVCTTSPEWAQSATKEQQIAFQQKSLAWAEKTFGKNNILSAVVHNDETTPHLSIHIVPRLDGQLNAKHWLGGRAKLTQLQNDFAEQHRELGLERGIAGSKAHHDKVKQYYERVNAPEKAPEKLLEHLNSLHIDWPKHLETLFKEENHWDYAKRCIVVALKAIEPRFEKLQQQLAAARKELKHYREKGAWTKSKAIVVKEVRAQNQELTNKVSSLESQLKLEKSKRERLERGIKSFLKEHGPTLSKEQRQSLEREGGLHNEIRR